MRRGALIAVVAAILVLGLLWWVGVDPITAVRHIVRGSVGGRSAWVFTLRRFAPLALCSLGIALAFRSGLWNIGGEGQLVCGALAAAAAGSLTGHWLPALLAGFAAGAGAAWVPAFLRVRRAVPEVLSTIMLNFAAIEVLRYAITGPLQEPSGQFPQTAVLPPGADLPEWSLIRTGGVHAGVPLAILLALLAALALTRTRLGLLLRATGSAPRAVQVAGYRVDRLRILAFCVSGALCGLAGAVEVTGVSHMVDRSMASGTGYAAIAVALLAGLRPALVLPAALLFAALASGTTSLQLSQDLPGMDRFAQVVQGIVILAVMGYLASHRRAAHG